MGRDPLWTLHMHLGFKLKLLVIKEWPILFHDENEPTQEVLWTTRTRVFAFINHTQGQTKIARGQFCDGRRHAMKPWHRKLDTEILNFLDQINEACEWIWSKVLARSWLCPTAAKVLLSFPVICGTEEIDHVERSRQRTQNGSSCLLCVICIEFIWLSESKFACFDPTDILENHSNPPTQHSLSSVL